MDTKQRRWMIMTILMNDHLFAFVVVFAVYIILLQLTASIDKDIASDVIIIAMLAGFMSLISFIFWAAPYLDATINTNPRIYTFLRVVLIIHLYVMCFGLFNLPLSILVV